MWISLLLLAFTLSIDALGIGAAYAVKKVTIPFHAKIIIGIMSIFIMWGSALIGQGMSAVLPKWCTNYLGLLILFLMGAIFIHIVITNVEANYYDINDSKKIEIGESILLAVALSADSISVGMAVGALQMSWFLLGIFVGLLQLFFLCIGLYIVGKGKKFATINSRISGMISGAMLILIGILRAFF